MAGVVDSVLTYQFLKKLTTPFAIKKNAGIQKRRVGRVNINEIKRMNAEIRSIPPKTLTKTI